MSAFDTPWFNSQDRGFFNSLNKSKIAHVILSAETEDFAEEVTEQWQHAGFHVVYVPLLNGGNDYIARVRTMGDQMGTSEQYAIVGNTLSSPVPSFLHDSRRSSRESNLVDSRLIKVIPQPTVTPPP
jgi:hypothetical protein